MGRAAFILVLFLCLNVQGQFTNVSVGTVANDGTGDTPRAAFQKVNYALNWINTNLTTVSNLTSAGTIVYYAGIADDSTSDDLALTNGLAAVSDLSITAGTFNFSTNITTGATKLLRVLPGGILKPATNVTITIGGDFEGPAQQCFDESAGGRVVFSSSSRTRRKNSLWWGADSTASADATSALRKWLYSGGGATEHFLAPGSYLITGELVASNNVVIVGSGKAGGGSGGSTLLVRVGANEAGIVVASGANRAKISHIKFSASGLSGTNSNAIRISDDCDYTEIFENVFDGFKGFAIYSTGTSVGNLYTKIHDNEFSLCKNTVAAGGNGLWPSGAIHSTNIFSHTEIWGNTVKTSDMAYLFHGGTTTNSGNVTVRKDALEGVGGGGALSTNLIAGDNMNQLNIIDCHIENDTVHNLVFLRQSKQINIRDTLLSGDFVTIKSTNCVYLDGVYSMNISGGRMSHPLSNYVVSVNNTLPVWIMGTYFDQGTAAPIADSAVTNYMVGDYRYLNLINP